MKCTLTILFFSLFLPALSHAEVDGPTLLFKNKGQNLSKSERQKIFDLLEVKLSTDGKDLVEQTCEEKAGFDVEIVDLNKDKTPEVVVIGGNTCISGATGSSIWLFIKDVQGIYRANLGFPAAGYEAMKHGSKGYPDLLIGGMGFCSAIWRWNGTKYQYLQNVPTAKGGCDAR